MVSPLRGESRARRPRRGDLSPRDARRASFGERHFLRARSFRFAVRGVAGVPSGGLQCRPAVPAHGYARRTASRSVRHPAPRSPRRALWHLGTSNPSPFHRCRTGGRPSGRVGSSVTKPPQPRHTGRHLSGRFGRDSRTRQPRPLHSGGRLSGVWGVSRSARQAAGVPVDGTAGRVVAAARHDAGTWLQRHPEICEPAGSAIHRMAPAATRVETRHPAARSGAGDCPTAGESPSAEDFAGDLADATVRVPEPAFPKFAARA